jgi:predicted nucleic acid-binding protein
LNRRKLYLDTSVWNFSFYDKAPEYQAATLEFFDKVRQGFFDIYFSQTVVEEIKPAPQPLRGLMEALVKEVAPQLLPESPEVARLAVLYLEKGVLPPKSVADAYHVAYATVHQMDAVVSWNFRHLASMNRRDRVASVNLDEGHRHPLNLVTPLEVLDND